MTHLSPQITHLVSARPMSVTMGNAIRQLKLEISGSDIDMPEQDVRIVLGSSFFTVKETGVYNRRRISYVKK
jgi:translation initiation factor 2B subunit (eIF-2B alpha/beta/delta family)